MPRAKVAAPQLAAVPAPVEPKAPKLAPYPLPYPDRPSPGLKWVWVIRGTFMPLVYLLPLGISLTFTLMVPRSSTASFDPLPLILVPVGILVLVFLIMLVWAPLAVRNYSFSIGDDEIVVRKGILFKTETHIPFHKVQDIVVRQGPLLRAFGIGSLNMVTAANAGPRRAMTPFSDGELPGIPDAAGLANHLLQKVKAQHRDF